MERVVSENSESMEAENVPVFWLWLERALPHNVFNHLLKINED
jgi:hypothetical protein